MGLNIHDKLRHDALIGKKFGKLTVLRKVDSYINKTEKSTSYRAKFECLCECGNLKIAEATKLRRGKIRQCSDCAYKSRPQSTERLTNLQRMFNLSIVNRCKKTKIENNLSIEQYETIIQQDCKYCGRKPKFINHLGKNRIALREDFYANGVDRIDSSKGYEITNCVPCCEQCNIMKSDYTVEEFLNQIEKIYNKWKKLDVITKES